MLGFAKGIPLAGLEGVLRMHQEPDIRRRGSSFQMGTFLNIKGIPPARARCVPIHYVRTRKFASVFRSVRSEFSWKERKL